MITKQVLIYILFCGLLIHSSECIASPIFIVKNKDGSILFTSKKPKEGTAAQEIKSREGSFSYYKVKGFPHFGFRLPKKLELEKFSQDILSASIAHGVEESLLRAVIHIESAFNPKALSPKGARGLMQLMPATARDLGVRNIFDIKDNINGGAKYLAWLLDRYNGNTAKALAAYNAGPGAVEEFGGIPPYAETKAYVRNVLTLKDKYQAKL